MDLSKNFYRKIFFTFLITFVYAVARYNIFGNVPWEELPLYITNKTISLTAIILLLISTIQKKNTKRTKQNIWKIIFILTLIHTFISFRLLGPEHYQKFYSGNVLNIIGYFTLFFGITAFTGLLILNGNKFLPKKDDKLSIPDFLKKAVRKWIPFLIAGHLIAMGITGWISPNTWPGFLIPISLIAFIGVIIYIIKTQRN